MNVSTRIKEVDDRLVIVIPKIIARNGELNPGDKLTINLQGKKMTIENSTIDELLMEKISNNLSEDVFSKTLTNEELILAK